MKKPNYKNYDRICYYLRDYRLYLLEKYGKAYTQSAVAKKMGFTSGQFLSNIERGLHLPPIDLTVQLFEYYDIDRVIAYHLLLSEREKELRKAILKDCK